MLGILFKKQREIQDLIYKYLDAVRTSLGHFSNALGSCLNQGICGDFEFLTQQTHKFESRADDIREEVKTLMYGKALLPESRGDIMGLLESIDEIPRICELVLQIMITQKLVIPQFIIADMRELLEVSLENCDLLFRQVETLFKEQEGIRAFLTRIDQNESLCDHIERRIITCIFDSEIDPFQKLQLKELILNLGEISDQADRTSRRVNIISMKRRV